jgi:TetR/AcrR family transcriptional regulator, transcriptional repressor for nem operon
MPKDGAVTRSAILDAAETLVYERGFAGMTIDQLLAKTGISKGSFFYHFKSREDLGEALAAHYAARDTGSLQKLMGRAERLATDPVEQVALFTGLVIEAIHEAHGVTGCIYGAYAGELQSVSGASREIVAQGFALYRDVLAKKFEAALATRKTLVPVTAESLADLFMTIYVGALLAGRATNEGDSLTNQLEHYRNYVRLVFGEA